MDYLNDTFSREIPNHGTCRHDPTLVCQIDGVCFFGGSISRMTDAALAKVKADLLINLTGTALYRQTKDTYIRKAGGRWAKLRDLVKAVEVEEIVIDWPDMGVIPAGAEFYREFFSLIRSGNKQNVVVFCIGGHGRTGTFLGCLMTVMNGVHGGKVIRSIREGYCKKAIESVKQENYIRSMTAIPQKKGGDGKR